MAAKRGRKKAAIAVSALAHLALLALVASQAPTLFVPAEPGGPPEPVIPVLLTPRLPPAATAPGERPGVVRLHRRQMRPPPSELTVAPLPVPPAPPAPTPAPAAPAAAVAPRAPVLPEGPREDLRAALRRSPIGCANPQSLSRDERQACEERLGAGSKAAPYIPAPIAPEIRAYYDAVAKAKEPDGPPTPQRAPGRLGMFDGLNVGMKGHGPSVGCGVALGPRGGPKQPAHGVKLGPLPCYVAPPAGSLSPDVDVVNPDSVVRQPPP